MSGCLSYIAIRNRLYSLNILGVKILSKYTKEDIKRLVQEEGVKFIRLQFTDIQGTIKNVEIPVS